MKSTGIVRKLDDLGRIVIPMELRRVFGITSEDDLEIFVEDDNIVLRKVEPRCVFCGSEDDLAEFKGKLVCGPCRQDLTNKT